MKNIIKTTLLLALPLLAEAQVKFDLSFEPATKVYTVTAWPEVTWAAPKNYVGSAQVVLRVASDQEFTPGITSLIDGLVWTDNSYVENPAGAAGYTFVGISLVNGPTPAIPFVAGQPVPLFSFVNSAGGCVGELTLLANDDPMVQAVRAGGYNITQHLAALGAGGNAVQGLANTTVDCTLTGAPEPAGETLVADVQLAPVPADKSVRIQWTLTADRHAYQELVITDVKGREVFREKVNGQPGRHAREIAVATWPAGLYRVWFNFGNQRTRAWNMMVAH